MLEGELAHVLSRGYEIKQLTVLENRNCFWFLRKLRSENCILRTVPLDRVQMLLKGGFSPEFKMFAKFLHPSYFSENYVRKSNREQEIE
jgi:hypothetical protein